MKLKAKNQRNYINRDFDGFRKDLLDYAKTYFPDKIQDFSEASMGGLLLDMAAYVGDNLSYYLDHQFHELNPLTAVESKNIETHVRNSGIKISGAAPSVVDVDFYIEVSTTTVNNKIIPDRTSIPIILKNTELLSDNGITFNLIEDIDFSETDSNGNLLSKIIPVSNSGSNPTSFILIRKGKCISGKITTETFSVGRFVPFLTVNLSNPNVSSIMSVFDSKGNQYYEVEHLGQDTVFRKIYNVNQPEYSLEIVSAPYRFVSYTSLNSRSTSITFGSGNEMSLEDENIPDPSLLAIPLYGKSTFSTYSQDPLQLLNSRTLGISPENTNLFITYRYGGGSNHNVAPRKINTISSLEIKFPDSADPQKSLNIRGSIAVRNEQEAQGGSPSPTVDEIKSYIPIARSSQNRVVSKEDLLSRIYTLPNEFGRIFRAQLAPNPNNLLSSALYIVSRNANNKLVQCSDILKKNISVYINEFRLIGDSIDVLDVAIINYRVFISVVAKLGVNKQNLQIELIDRISKITKIENYQIGQPINESDFISEILSVSGVLSLVSISFESVYGTIINSKYTDYFVEMENRHVNGNYFANPNEIFECRFPEIDISVEVI
ncbi:hypothetical protein [Limnobacter sp.]|uniref:hypothetical protein n=1 Tax=Limnobacter sp. TaxID=2003368 RepID=UPI00311F8AC6